MAGKKEPTYLVLAEDELLEMGPTPHATVIRKGGNVNIHKGKYGNIPVLIMKDGPLGDELYMQARGINRANTRANRTMLHEKIKHMVN